MTNPLNTASAAMLTDWTAPVAEQRRTLPWWLFADHLSDMPVEEMELSGDRLWSGTVTIADEGEGAVVAVEVDGGSATDEDGEPALFSDAEVLAAINAGCTAHFAEALALHLAELRYYGEAA